MSRIRADLLLLLSAFIWGTAFIAQKHANLNMGPITFVGTRFFLSWLMLAPFVFYEKKGATPLSKRDLGIASAIGVCLFVGATLQQVGLVTTTATNGGFLTALYVVFVPFVVWIIARKKPRSAVLLACALSLGGAWLLAGRGPLQQWVLGDALIVIADLAWAIGISLVPVFLQWTHRPFFLSFAQYGITAFLGLVAGVLYEPFSSDGITAALPSILYAGFLSGGVAFTLQIIAQKYTPAPEAALIMSLESVFAALSGGILLNERLSLPQTFGCLLIFLGVIMVEVGPAIQSTRKVQSTRNAESST